MYIIQNIVRLNKIFIQTERIYEVYEYENNVLYSSVGTSWSTESALANCTFFPPGSMETR